MMDEAQLVADASPIVRAMAPGIFASLGIRIRSGQDRKNLNADQAVVKGMLEAGQTNFRYRGLVMEFEAFDEAHNEEIRRLVTNTVNAMSKAGSLVDWSKVDLGQFSPEFRRRWISEASNVSDETLQSLWARLLAGELESPGSVSNDTMSIARDMNRQCAEEFQAFCSAALCYLDGRPMIVVGCGNPGANSLRPYGLSYAVLMKLAHHRLIVNDMTSYREFASGSSQPTLEVRQQKSTWLLRWANAETPPDAKRHIKGILFTPAGEELFPVVQKVPTPAYTAAMLISLEKDGWTVTPLTP